MRRIDSIESLEQVLNASVEEAMASCIASGINSTEEGRSSLTNLIDSYERAGKLLLNTAKTLRMFGTAKTDNNCGQNSL